MCRIIHHLSLALALFTISGTVLRADVFRYKDGRVISGTVKAKSQKQVENIQVTVWTVEVEPGTYLQVLDSELVRNGHEALSSAEQEYVKNIASLQETAEAHCEIAAWCTQRGMVNLAKAHYRRALDLNPDHDAARAAAGYKKDNNGRWVKKEKIYGEQRGKVFYKGRWRFPESVAIEQAEEEADRLIAPLKKKLSGWHHDAAFGKGSKYQAAIANIKQIRDPKAVGILSEYLLDSRKPPPLPLKLMYVQVLSRFKSGGSAQTLATLSIRDPDQQVRNACLDALENFGEELAIPMFISYLGNGDNELVNRAAEGLGQHNSAAAILPLIESLNTQHEIQVGGGAGINANTQGGLAFGGNAKKKKVMLQNASVHGTLTQLTGKNFNYDEPSWLAWYSSVYGAPAGDLRRDP